jgi:tetratricopeptide (TPR) repeat protein
MQDRSAAAGVRYAAFISYSHKDAAAARWLHRKLEGYRLPKRLVGSDGRHGPVPARLTPIFRDREELPAAGDLSETVRAALAVSDALIILCSPHAAASPWVGREIAVFRELHPGRPVYAAIVAGEPAEAFPPELTAGGTVEPLAADLRKQGDGRRLGFLKLVAGLAGTNLDALVQRDAARKMRRVTAVTAAALAAMLIMAVMTTLALQARAEADRQRAEAEGLVEFMLTDVRRDLRKVGRLDIMTVVNERALSYYSAQRVGDPSAGSAVQARVDQTIGEDLLTRGDADAADRFFRRAYEITSSLINQFPRDPKIIFVHAQSEYWLGRAYELRRDWPLAEQQYGRFAVLTDRLIFIAPENPDYMMQVAWAAVDLGNVQLNGSRNPEAAQRSYEKAVRWFGRAVEARPKDTRARLSHANALGWLADSFFMRGMWQDSLQARLQQYRIVEQLYRADPENMEHGFRLALAQRGLARSYAKAAVTDTAQVLMHRAHEWSRRLTKHDPSNADWLLFSAFVGCDLYFGKLGLPTGVTKDAVARDIRNAAIALRAQMNPRASEFTNCVRALTPDEGDFL